MSDGLHSDSSGETLEELRIRKDNPYITALSPRQMEKRMRLYRQALCAPFEEITKKEYLERLNVLPPIRKREDSFFLSEPYYGELAEFCFTRENRFFKGIRSVCTPQAILDKEVDRHMELIRRKAFLLKGKDTPVGDNDTDLWHMTPYSFSVDGKAPVFLCNLVYRDDRRQARTDMAHTLKSLRNSHYRYCWGKGTYETPDCLMDRAFQENLTLISGGCFFQYPTNRESAHFLRTGQGDRRRIPFPYLRPGLLPLSAEAAEDGQERELHGKHFRFIHLKNYPVMKEGDIVFLKRPYRGYRAVELIERLPYRWLVRVVESGLELEVYEDELAAEN